MAQATNTEQETKTKRVKVREGLVVSNKMKKTVVVAVTRQVQHATYGKYIRRTKKFMAHDENNQCNIGDRVRIEETTPLSKHKRWMIKEIVTKAD